MQPTSRHAVWHGSQNLLHEQGWAVRLGTSQKTACLTASSLQPT